MRLVRTGLAMSCLVLLPLAPAANAELIINTWSSATQTITSPLIPGTSIVLDAAGTQQFTIDTATGFANVVSDFKGSDFETPLGTATYDLYNTMTTGTVTDNGGSYTISYSLLFELKITSGPLEGVIFETLTDSIFETTVSSLPFPPGTAFGDPARPNDPTGIFLKADPNGVLASLGVTIGSQVGVSSDRVVTVLSIVPEPTSALLLGLGVSSLVSYARWRRSRS